ncbi:polysaccharide deacetylase [Paenibacillus ihumii]|uniref:polysaccharide deacetylase n=1 Tax=Paenibacillus ihumii TaxID=687436 RepID=UPI000AC9F8E5|nr:polysaccharide deacetylase [Paenibacillus ihumii]
MKIKWLAGLPLFRMITAVIALVLIVTVIPYSESRGVMPEAAARSHGFAAAAPAAQAASAALAASAASAVSSAPAASRTPALPTTPVALATSTALKTPAASTAPITSTAPAAALTTSTALTAPATSTAPVASLAFAGSGAPAAFGALAAGAAPSQESSARSSFPLTESDKTLQPESSRQFASHAKPKEASKVVYLTFDDGPSKWTDDVLEILQKADVPATFFVLGEQAKRFPEIINRIDEAGHEIGNHTYNHKYDELYASFGAFWSQIKETEEVLRNITGKRTPLVRAPGGTYGHFDAAFFQLLEQGGYKVFDWNLDSGDSRRRGVPASEIIKNVTSAKPASSVNLLMHDSAGHEETVKALPKIIEYYKSLGYEFRPLTPEVAPVQFAVAPKMKNSKRPQPSSEWIKAHIVPNAALFGPGEPLYIEAGGVETKLAAGEYELQGGQYRVPLRTVMERLGAEVRWHEGERSAVVTWGDTRILVSLDDDLIVVEVQGEIAASYTASLDQKSGLLWLPLRTLLEATGHSIVSVSANPEERRVRAS